MLCFDGREKAAAVNAAICPNHLVTSPAQRLGADITQLAGPYLALQRTCVEKARRRSPTLRLFEPA
jgi:hypothetical protein